MAFKALFRKNSKSKCQPPPLDSSYTPPGYPQEKDSPLSPKTPQFPQPPRTLEGPPAYNSLPSIPQDAVPELSPSSPKYPSMIYSDAHFTAMALAQDAGPAFQTDPNAIYYGVSSAPPMDPYISRRSSYRDDRHIVADPYEGLAQFDTVFLIDDSGSMSGANWRETSEALSAIVPICTARDSDGVDIYFLNNPIMHTGIRSSAEVLSIFSAVRPSGATPTGRRLGDLFDMYLKSYRRNKHIKPMNIIVITDGEPTDPRKLEKNIISTAGELDRLKAKDRQIGVQFFQVGSDEAATESLEELDNSLVEEHNVRDMVDTVSWKKMNEGKGLSVDGILKVVMGAVDKRLDRTRKV